MHLYKLLAVSMLHLTVGCSECTASTQCGDVPSCPAGQHCETATFTTPASTTITTCVPSPTCLSVYQSCVSGGTGPRCCSDVCAATKCRASDPDWPNCREDGHPCLADENCCYDNKCLDGLCAKPEES